MGTQSSLGWFCVGLFITLALHLVDLARMRPDVNMPGYLAEGGPFQNLQLAVLGWALLLCAVGIWTRSGTVRGALVFLVGPCFLLFWRESDWDKDYLGPWLGADNGVRMFSWAYLVRGAEVPGLLKLVYGVVSLGLTFTWLAVCWRYRASLRALWELVRSGSAWIWLMVTGLFLGASVVLDKSWLMGAAHRGVRDPYLEEAPELLGELAWLFFILAVLGNASKGLLQRRDRVRAECEPKDWSAGRGLELAGGEGSQAESKGRQGLAR
jgi:hypothetical protein